MDLARERSRLSKDARSDMDWGGTGAPPRVRGLPIIKPPYSRITAIDLNTGEHAWMVPSGDTPPDIKNNPALAGLTIKPTGAQSRPVMLATKTLLFTAEGSAGQPILRALDKKTGEKVWEMTLPGAVGSVPMTYAIGDRQFIAFWVADRASELPGDARRDCDSRRPDGARRRSVDVVRPVRQVRLVRQVRGTSWRWPTFFSHDLPDAEWNDSPGRLSAGLRADFELIRPGRESRERQHRVEYRLPMLPLCARRPLRSSVLGAGDEGPVSFSVTVTAASFDPQNARAKTRSVSV